MKIRLRKKKSKKQSFAAKAEEEEAAATAAAEAEAEAAGQEQEKEMEDEGPPPCGGVLSVLDASPDAAVVFRSDGAVEYMNDPARRLFGVGGDGDGDGGNGDGDWDGWRRSEGGEELSSSTLLSFSPKIGRADPDPEEGEGGGGGTEENGNEVTATAGWDDIVKRFANGAKGATRLDAVGRKRSRGGGGGDGEGGTFPLSLSVSKLPGCPCCLGRRGDRGMAKTADSDANDMYCAQIRDRSPAEQRLRESEREVVRLERTLRAVVKATDDSTIVVDEYGIIRSADDATLRQFGYARSELIGRNIKMLMNDNHGRRHDGYIKAYLRSGVAKVIGKRRELDARRKDGTSFPIELGVAEIESDPGEKRSFAGMICNITERSEAQRKVEEAEQQRLAILDANKDAMFGLTSKGRIETANKAASRMFGYDAEELVGKPITALISREDVEIVTQELLHGGFKFSLPEEMGGSVAQSASKDDARSEGKDKDSHSQSMSSLGSLSQSMGSRNSGTYSYLTSSSKGSQYDIAVERELTGVRRDGSKFPISLDLARMSSRNMPGKTRPCAAFVRDLTRRKIQEAELALRVALNEGVFNASFDPIFLINERCIIEMANEAAARQFGWSPEELVGKNISAVVGGGHAKKHDGYIKRYLRTGEKRVMGKSRELQARRRDGTEFPIELGLTEVNTEDGEMRRFCGFIKDLTRRKAYEADIKRKQRLTNGVLDAAFQSMFAINEKGIIEMVNEASVKKFGYSRDELIGKNISMVVGGKHAEKHDEYIERYLRTGEKRVMGKHRELQARKKDGTEFPIELGLTEVQGEDGEQRRFCGFIKDLTSKKAFEADIRRKQMLTNGIIEASFDAMFTINERGTIEIINEEAVRQFGWTREELIGANISIIAGGIHSKNHDKYLANYLRTGVKKVMGMQRELLAKRKDGSEFPIELGLTEVTMNDIGERRFCGFIRNLTQQKAHEKEIKRKENMTKGIIEASLAAVFAIDVDGVIQMVNGSAVKEFGWSKDEFLGSNIDMILAEQTSSGNHGHFIKNYINSGKHIGSEEQWSARAKDGSLIPITIGLSEVEHSGSSRLFAAYVHNMTQQNKIREMEIESSKAEALLLNMLPEGIALRLKDDKGHIADHYSSVAILFADIVGFTAMSSRMSPVEVVGMLNELFSMFDEIVERYDLNKVKTIGDCYMVTSHPGVESEKNESSHMCAFGLDMIEALQEYNKKNPHHNLNLRVGINIGPVVAGVVGTKRFLYDLWGDSVNLASRMESTGIPGKIQVTQAVADFSKDEFTFESRGFVHVKGKGEMETFMLIGPKHPLKDMAPVRRRPSKSILRSGKTSLMTSLRNLKSSKQILDTKIVELESYLEEDNDSPVE